MFSVCFHVRPAPGQAGLVLWWNMEQRGRSADTVSCQPLSASESLRESHSRSSTGHPKICPRSPVASYQCPFNVPTSLCVRLLFQVGARQSDVPVSHPPDGPASAQRRLLRHCGPLAGLHGRPQADHRPVHTSAERRVSAPRFHFPFWRDTPSAPPFRTSRTS